MEQSLPRIGLIGLGLMGFPMAENWLKKKFPLAVLPHKNRRNAEILEKSGVKICDSLESLVKNSDVIVLMVPTSREVEGLTIASDGLLKFLKPAQIVIDMSTSDPASTRKIYQKFQDRNLRFYDAPVTGGVSGAANGTLTLFIGGPVSWFEETKPVLEAVSRFQKHFGAVGNGHVAKLINNFICIGNLAVFSEALVLGVKQGLKSKDLLDTLLSGTASSEMLKFYGPQILNGDFNPRFKLTHAEKDLKLAESLTEDLAASFPCLEGVLSDLRRAMESGYGEENVSSVIRPLEDELNAPFRS